MKQLAISLAFVAWAWCGLPAFADGRAASVRVVETPLSREVERSREQRVELVGGRRVVHQVDRAVEVLTVRVDTVERRLVRWREAQKVNRPFDEPVWTQTGVEMDLDALEAKPVYGWVTRRVDPHWVEELVDRERVEEHVVGSEIQLRRRPLEEVRRQLRAPSASVGVTGGSDDRMLVVGGATRRGPVGARDGGRSDTQQRAQVGSRKVVATAADALPEGPGGTWTWRGLLRENGKPGRLDLVVSFEPEGADVWRVRLGDHLIRVTAVQEPDGLRFRSSGSAGPTLDAVWRRGRWQAKVTWGEGGLDRVWLLEVARPEPQP